MKKNILYKSIVLCLIISLPFLIFGCGTMSSLSSDSNNNPLNSVQVSGTIQLPAGINIPTSSFSIRNLLEHSAVNDDLSYSINQIETGPSVLALTDTENNIILLGYSNQTNPSDSKISALSTAVSLMFIDINGQSLPAENWANVLTALEKDPAIKTLANIIEARIASDNYALLNGDSVISDAINQTRANIQSRIASINSESISKKTTLIKSSEIQEPAIISVPNATMESGIKIDPSLTDNGVTITNWYRRHCYYWVFYTGYKNQLDIEQNLSNADWILVKEGYIKSTAGLSGFIGTSVDYFLKKPAYEPVIEGPFDLAVAADTQAVETYYRIVYVGGTTLPNYIPPAWADDADPTHRDMFFAKQNLMSTITIVKDYFIPIAFALAPKSAVSSMTGRDLGDFCTGMITLFISSGVNIAPNIAKNDYKGAGELLLKNFIKDTTIRKAVTKYFLQQAFKKGVSEAVLEDAEYFSVALNAVLKKFDIGMMFYDVSCVNDDLANSNGYDYKDVIALKPRTHIEPSVTSIKPGEEKKFTAIKGTITGDVIEYRWSTKGLSGRIHKWNDPTPANKLTTSEDNIVYQANLSAQDKAIEVLSVEVWRKQITDTGVIEQKIGESSSTINISNSPAQNIHIKHKVSINNGDPLGNSLFDIAYFIIPKINGANSYLFTLNDNGYPYQGSSLKSKGYYAGDIHTEEFPLQPGHSYTLFPFEFASNNGAIIYLYDPADENNSNNYLKDIIDIAPNEMALIMQRGTTPYRIKILDYTQDPAPYELIPAEQVYQENGLQPMWEYFVSRAENWTLSYKKW